MPQPLAERCFPGFGEPRDSCGRFRHEFGAFTSVSERTRRKHVFGFVDVVRS
jgi:hypothetical protein